MFVTRSSKRQHFSQRDATSLNESSWNLDRIPPACKRARSADSGQFASRLPHQTGNPLVAEG